MRSIEKTIQEILDTIPETFEAKSLLSIRLSKIISDSHFTAPETMGLRWQQLGELLQYYLTEFTNLEEDAEWCQKIKNIIQVKEPIPMTHKRIDKENRTWFPFYVHDPDEEKKETVELNLALFGDDYMLHRNVHGLTKEVALELGKYLIEEAEKLSQ